jgi:hypothetical protein
MDLGRPFSVVTPTVDGDVLLVLAGADRAFTPPEVHRLLGERSESGVRKALDRLADQGVVERARVGRAKTYRLDEHHLAHPHLVALARLKDELVDRLREDLAAWTPAPPYAALFGSAVQGGMRPDSDIDVFVVRPDEVPPEDGGWRAQVDALEAKASRWTGNDVRTLELSASEVRAALAEGNNRAMDDIRTGGVRLVGPRTFLADRGAG